MKVRQQHISGEAGSGMWKSLQIDLGQFFFHTEKQRGQRINLLGEI